METLISCPVCKETNFTPFLECKDYTVSCETFTIVWCNSCEFKFTNPRPEAKHLGKYYESDNYVSHSKSNKGFINSLYHIAKYYSLLKKIQLINSLSKKGKILDYGCGTGDFLNTCKVSGWEVSGIEPNQLARTTSIELLKTEIKSEDIKVKNGVLILNIKPIYKSQILIKREEILEKIGNALGKKAPIDIR